MNNILWYCTLHDQHFMTLHFTWSTFYDTALYMINILWHYALHEQHFMILHFTWSTFYDTALYMINILWHCTLHDQHFMIIMVVVSVAWCLTDACGSILHFTWSTFCNNDSHVYSVVCDWRVTAFCTLHDQHFMIIMAVMSVAWYVTDMWQHSVLYMISILW